MILTPKYWDFLLHEAQVEFLEGTTHSGKTTVALLKFMLAVAESPRRMHLLCGLDVGTVESHMLQKEYGIMEVFGHYIKYVNNHSSKPHILFRTPTGRKAIYVMGFADKARWKKTLGGQYGCAMVDEVNVADMDFVRELSVRCDYFLATLNPDDTSLPVYREYINRSRPLPAWADETPTELLSELTEAPQENWTHWYFTFRDNAGLTAEKRAQIEAAAAPGTKLYRNKILGLRGRADGLVFPLEADNIITAAAAKKLRYALYTCGVDTSYSVKSADAFAFIFMGITKDGRKVALAEKVWNNRDLTTPVSPSDLPGVLYSFLEKCRAAWGFARDVYIDSADQATILECAKFKARTRCLYRFLPAWKRLRVVDRLHLEAGWLAQGVSLIAEDCTALLKEINSCTWAADGQPPDGNDHAINAWQYAWMPYAAKLGKHSGAACTSPSGMV